MGNDLTPHKTWDVFDNSKISLFKTCPRKYFFRHVLGWTSELPNIDLVFGQAWHIAMEHLLLNKRGGRYLDDTLTEAHAMLSEYYREYFPDQMEDEFYAPKTPGNALIALAEYAATYREDLEVVLQTEIAGTIMIDEDRVFHFKMDSTLKSVEGYIFSRDHKTATRHDKIWVDKFVLDSQPGGYYTALVMLYGPEVVRGIEMSGTFLKKTGNTFERVMISKTPDMIQVWLYNINHYIDMILWCHQELEKCDAEHDVLTAFPMDDESCTKYYRLCPYHAICSTRCNPLRHTKMLPEGLKIEYWDPRENRERASHVEDLGKPKV
ncbi:hypothetical protein LCGC14_1496880 [marine sediment metagenome]|uniref:PD-(D/E)XK endonuclease-like domain-containing protein n=1 Tax=marine sediment metagenome TaxID=412755 RepID=A0A0F9M6S8_9ZZZZ